MCVYYALYHWYNAYWLLYRLKQRRYCFALGREAMWRYKISGHCSHCSPLTGTGLHDAHACLSAGVGWGCSPCCCLSTDRLMHTVNGSGRTRRCVSLILYAVIYTWCGFGSSYATERFSRNFHCLPEVYIWACHVACSHKTLRYCERQLIWELLA